MAEQVLESKQKRSSTGPKRTSDQILRDRAEIARLRLQGLTQEQITEWFKTYRTYELSQTTIANDLKAVRAEWMASSVKAYQKIPDKTKKNTGNTKKTHPKSKQGSSDTKQTHARGKGVQSKAEDKITRRFGTPKDRQSIENLKRIYLLDQMGFYAPCWPYFDPTSQSVIFYFHNDDEKNIFNHDYPEKLPPVVMLWELWEIPDDHPFFSDLTCIRWDWEIDEHKSNEQLKESLERLKLLDEILIRPIENKNGTTMFDELAWSIRICGFFRGDFEEILTPTQEGLILDFIESSMAVASKELDKFYVPFVEIPVRTA